MFREMRRKNQLLSKPECEEILNTASYGVLSVIGDDGYPYGVPLNFVYLDGKIYMHCAKAGHKIDAIKGNPKVSFCVVGEQEVIPAKYTTYYKSAVIFGKAKTVDDEELKFRAIKSLTERFCKNDESGIKREMGTCMNALCIIELEIEHMTGKEYRPPQA